MLLNHKVSYQDFSNTRLTNRTRKKAWGTILIMIIGKTDGMEAPQDNLVATMDTITTTMDIRIITVGTMGWATTLTPTIATSK